MKDKREDQKMTLTLNKNNHTAETAKGTTYLTPTEFSILSYLMEHDGDYSTPEDIYAGVWQAEPFACRPLIAVHIRHLREKIEPDPSEPTYVKVIWGKGYRYNG